jgi:ribonuclease HI
MPESKHYLETDASVRPGVRRKSGVSASMGGAGIVLWDPELRVVLAESVPLGAVSCGPEAEVRAVLTGLRRAAELNVERLRLRSDCISVIRYLTGEGDLDAQWAAPLKEELNGRWRSFAFAEARWTPSSHANERGAGVPTADFLARRAVGLGPRRVGRRRRDSSG